MLNSLKSWFGQVTTGQGMMVLAGTLLSVLSGTNTWISAAPLLTAGVIGLIWPENTALQMAGQTVATDVLGAVAAYSNKGTTPASSSKSSG